VPFKSEIKCGFKCVLRTYTLSSHLVSTLCPKGLQVRRPHSRPRPRPRSRYYRYCRNCRYCRYCRRGGKRPLARETKDEQTLVPPVAAALAFCSVPSVRLAGTASPYLCWRAFAGAAIFPLSCFPDSNTSRSFRIAHDAARSPANHKSKNQSSRQQQASMV